MKRLASIALLAIFVALVGATPSSAQEGVIIREVDTSKFPEVTVAVAGGADPAAILVFEDGAAVTDKKVSTFGQAGEAVDVVLAIDTSGSMQGAAMASAIQAATSFVQGLPEHVRVGIVTFSSTPRVALRLTHDLDRALEVIGGLQATGETALYDAVARSSTLFRDASQRNVILLSDGGDTTSKLSLDQAAKAAGAKDAAVFSVGIEGSEQDVAALRQISQKTGGAYAPAATAELAGVYETLATELSEQVLITYTSTASGGAQVPIRVAAAGSGEDSTLVLMPRPPVPEKEPQTVAPPSDPILDGTFGLLVVLLTAFAAIFLILYSIFGSRAAKRRDTFLGRRFGLKSATPEIDDESDGRPGGWIPTSLVEMGDQIAQTGGLSNTLEIKLQRSGWKLKVGEFVAMAFLSALGGGILGLLLIQTPVFIALATFAGGMTPFVILSTRMRRRLSRLHAQLPDILMIIASSLRAGHSFLQALQAVSQEAGEPGASEFDRLMTEIRLGRPINVAMNDLADRVGSMDFKWAVLAVDIQRDVGGNLSEVLDTVAETMRERDRVRRQVEVLSTEGRMSIYILAGLPIGVGLWMGISNPGYIGLLFSTTIGLVMLSIASVLLLVGVLWMKKVVKIHV